MQATQAMPHIWLDEKGRAWIDDTNTKVVEVALDHVGYGWTVEEMHANHPHLSMAQLHAAMACYFDHKDYFDAEIDRIGKQADALAASQKDSPLRQKLRNIGKL